MTNQKITTEKIPGETEKEYTAWLLYCEYKSIDKLLKAWEGIDTKATEMRPELAGLIEKLGEPPARTTIARWSKKFHWVERTDLKLAEDLQSMRERSKKIAREKKHKVLEIFETIVNKVRKELKAREGLTIDELKKAWEMAQVEMGLPTSRPELGLKQQPRTPEEKERAKLVDEILEPYLTGKKPILPPPLDSKRGDKKRKRRTN